MFVAPARVCLVLLLDFWAFRTSLRHIYTLGCLMTWFLKGKARKISFSDHKKNLLCQLLINPNSPICMAAKSMSIPIIPKCTGFAHASLNSHKHITNPCMHTNIFAPLLLPLTHSLVINHLAAGYTYMCINIWLAATSLGSLCTYRASTGKVGLGLGVGGWFTREHTDAPYVSEDARVRSRPLATTDPVTLEWSVPKPFRWTYRWLDTA